MIITSKRRGKFCHAGTSQTVKPSPLDTGDSPCIKSDRSAAMTDAALLLDMTDGVALITLNRPRQRNSLTRTLASNLRDAVADIARNPAVRAVLLRAEGEHFMVGADLHWLATLVDPMPHDRLATLVGAAPHDGDDNAVDLQRAARRRVEVAAIIDDVHAAILGLRQLPQPVVIAVRGAVAGFGLSLACAADLLLAADDARFTVAYNALGASTDGGLAWHLPRLIGAQRAMAMALLNETIDAATAQQAGLVYRVTRGDELDAAALALARRLAQGPAAGQASIKRLINFSAERTLAQHLQQEADAFLAACDSVDFAEGVRAFVAKRPPRFGQP
jgi:2-(1,2-epoxy-1,2-dihydrophenyl)acetyl-CoA isomerase